MFRCTLDCARVIDTGIGIEAELLDRTFDPFTSTMQAGLDSGSGLTIGMGTARQTQGIYRSSVCASAGDGADVLLAAAASSARGQFYFCVL